MPRYETAGYMLSTFFNVIALVLFIVCGALLLLMVASQKSALPYRKGGLLKRDKSSPRLMQCSARNGIDTRHQGLNLAGGVPAQ
jgi:hypothetical protein